MNRRSLYLLLALCATAPCGRALDLVRDGQPQVVVLLGEAPEKGRGTRFTEADVENAARELLDGVRRMSQAELPVRRIAESDLAASLEAVRAEGKRPVLLGALGQKYLEASATPAFKDEGSFLIHVTDEMAVIAGKEARGTEIGVYEALEQLGMRWYLPGDLGTVVPSLSTVTLKKQETLQNPTFQARHFGFNALDSDPATADWKRHQREGGLFIPPAHGIRLGDDGSFEVHPEFYALVDGKRTEAQVCVSNPEVLKRAIEETKKFFHENPDALCIGMGPKDGGDFCQCDGCRSWDSGDWDPFSNEPSVTDRYVRFFNEVLKGIEKEWPGKKIAFYIYHSYMRPPVNVSPDPRIIGALAPIGLCRIHGMNNPVCPEKGYLKGLIADWKKVLPEVYERGYWFNLADPGMPFMQMHRLRDEIPYYAAHGCSGFRTEVTPQWAAQGPSLYVAGRLMWDAGADADAILRDYCTNLFGPAAELMIQYYSFLDKRLEQGDWHTGCAFDLLKFFPAEIRREAGALLTDAEKRATESPFKERLKIDRLGFSHMDAFARMLEARDNGDWAAAKAALDAMDAAREELTDREMPMLGRPALNYLRRFFRLPIEQGYARSRDGNTILASLGDTWQSLLDPQRIGEDLHYYADELRGGNWQPMPTFTTTWSNIGLRYYKGLAWYRQSVELPSTTKGKVFLWFGGVDEAAKVWVNGKPAGTGPGSAFTPFELDVSEYVRPGINTVTVCVANLRVDELGTGGITAPAFFYAPALGEKAVPENIKPLRRTFP